MVVTDIDGTLVRHDKTLSDANVAAVGRLRDAGVAVTLISARPPSGIRWLADRLGLDGPLGAFNGGTLVMRDGAVRLAERLAPAIAARALALCDDPAVTLWLFADGHWYARGTDNPHTASERRSAGEEPVIVADFATLLARVDKIVAVSDDHDRLAEVETRVAAALGTDATVARSQPYYLDVTAPRGNKGDGVAALAEAFGVSLAEVAVIGDQRNDLPMIARAGVSVAMAQAPDVVRAAADHVARSNDDDGVADAIDRIILPLVASGR